MKYTRLFAAAAVSSLLAACGGGGTVVPANNTVAPSSSDRSQEFSSVSTFVAQNTTTGEFVRVVPTRSVMDAFRASAAGQRFTHSGSNMTYHGGPVQTNPKIYVVYWGSAWNGSSGDPNGVRSYYNAFLGVIGGSAWLNTVTQYTQSDGQHVGNQSGSFVGSYVDTTSSPPSRPTQSQLAAEATKAAGHYGDYSVNASYIVALPHGIRPSGFGTQYCAWHSSTGTSHGTIAYTNEPYLPDVGYSCGAGSVNNPGTLDGVSIVGGHEQAETETDPQPNTGWLDSSNAEIGDKCAWMNLEDNPNAGNYPTQPLWSNASSSCVQSYP
ncbi:MAG: hypothetical protein JO083_01340 [Candidatus Eremiobacteraeota bacterium]|nr:hypothetical protein [Candidatus Eremiobacteraeota bacterium]MBV8367419.1 hypothetical protein [Candidatus Eremiobacteraeota bacterium]